MMKVHGYSLLEALITVGIEAARYEESFVVNTIQKRMAETKHATPEAYIDYLKENQSEVHVIESLLQNSYSEFFRNPLTFSVLEKIILPSLIAGKNHKGKELRIWSAACASGQEPYSIAMMLEESGYSRIEPVRYRIFASDRSKVQIDNARQGCYSSFNMGQVSMKRLSTWFDADKPTNQDTCYCIKNELKRNIDFSVFDLFEEHAGVPPSSIFGDFDLVFCANLLFYYKPVFREIILKKIYKSMTMSGLLVVGESERELLKQQGMTEIFLQSGIFRF